MKTDSTNDPASRKAGQRILLIVVLAVPSIWMLLRWPPLWRDVDGFNQVASTFAPNGIIHWLPGYCFFGRLILILGAVLGSLLSGHGLPYLSLGTPTLNDTGVYSLIIVQHILLVGSLAYLVRSLTTRFVWQIVFALFFVATPWLYAFAQCIGSEAFSNPLIILCAASGWKCCREARTSRKNLFLFFGLLVATLLTRQVNLLMVTLLPIALLVLMLLEFGWFARSALANRFREIRLVRGKFLVYVAAGCLAVLTSFGVQTVLCWCFRVPFRSTLGRTFEWRLRYLHDFPVTDRSALLARISRNLNDPMLVAALADLDSSLRSGASWDDLFLLHDLHGRLAAAGVKDHVQRDYLADQKLNRLAREFLLPPEPSLVHAIIVDVSRIQFLTQAHLSGGPFDGTVVLAHFLPEPRYARLRPLASFQQPSELLVTRWERSAYLQLLNNIPFIWLAPIAAGAALLLLRWRSRQTFAGFSYAVALLLVGGLFAVGSFSTTCFDARFLLPTYSCWQIALLLAIAVNLEARSARGERIPRKEPASLANP